MLILNIVNDTICPEQFFRGVGGGGGVAWSLDQHKDTELYIIR